MDTEGFLDSLNDMAIYNVTRRKNWHKYWEYSGATKFPYLLMNCTIME